MGKRTFAIFVIAYLVTLVINAPASLLDQSLQYATQGRLALANASGTIWDGAASPALRQQTGRYIALQPLHWNISALALFSGEIRGKLRWDEMPQATAMDAVISHGEIELQHALIPLPASTLGEASPILAPAGITGQLQMRSERLVLSNRGMEGVAIVDWQQAGSALSNITPLGDYRLTLNGNGENIGIALATISGVLQLQGEGNWRATRGLSFHGRARASGKNPESLAELLHHLGPEESPGVHGFNLTPQ